MNRPRLIQTSTHNKIIALGWRTIEEAMGILIRNVKQVGPFDVILALVRGGCIPAVFLSHFFNKRHIIFLQGMKTASDNPHEYQKFRLIAAPTIEKNKKILIVEDIIFQGDTVGSAIDCVSSQGGKIAGVCALVGDENFLNNTTFGGPIPFVIAYRCRHLQWIRFPWEKRIKGEAVLRTKA